MIEWIVTSSALILLVLVLRLIIRERISPRLRYALWGLVLLRLLIPGTLFQSRASVMTPVAAREQYQAMEHIPSYIPPQPDGSMEIGNPDGGGWTSIPEAQIPSGGTVAYDRPLKEAGLESLQKQVNFRDAFSFVWLGGVVAVGAFLLVVNLKFDRNLKKNRRMPEQYRRCRVFLVEGLPTPCLFGLLQPCIYLTPDVAEDKTAKVHILAHEYTHFRQGDHIWTLLRGVCLALHWYNPLVWAAAVLSRRDCELSCDEGAVQMLGEERRADYGRTLVGLVSRRTTAADLARCTTTMTGGKSALKERVALLVKRPRTTAVMAVIVAATCAVFAFCTFTGAAEAEETIEPPLQDENTQQTDGEPPLQAEDTQQPEDGPQVQAGDTSQAESESQGLDSAQELPSLDELPRSIVTSPEGYDEPIWLMAELPADDIAVYYEQQSGASLLRYGSHLQRVTEHLDGHNLPELYFEDLDGDGRNELAVTYNSLWGTGAYVSSFVVYEWDDESLKWTGYSAHLAEDIISDFNANRTLTIYPDQGCAVVGYNGEELSVNLEKLFGDISQWSGKKIDCELQEMYYSYSMESYGLTLKIGGEIRPEGFTPTICYAFDYICSVYYEGDGMFRSWWGYLNTDYVWSPKVDEERLTDTFRDILRSFIQETPGAEQADLINNYFAICDINGDGRDELITQFNNGITASHAEEVYDQDGHILLSVYPGGVTYYDNGYVTAGWSHNQGRAGDKLWPYDLLKLDDSGNHPRYVWVACVDGWDKQHGETYESFNPANYGTLTFPDDVDKDGDGFVYYIITESGGYAPAYGTPVDYDEWAEWAEVYLSGNVITPIYMRFTEENIALIE